MARIKKAKLDHDTFEGKTLIPEVNQEGEKNSGRM
jgi:hypothetical protein